ncbi:hypothetical protein HDU96_003112 [Phlyctochytrium bullatum]|nr:hypothetical protein HDU96_003112 [Phlyctochytrium bullatum]
MLTDFILDELVRYAGMLKGWRPLILGLTVGYVAVKVPPSLLVSGSTQLTTFDFLKLLTRTIDPFFLAAFGGSRYARKELVKERFRRGRVHKTLTPFGYSTIIMGPELVKWALVTNKDKFTSGAERMPTLLKNMFINSLVAVEGGEHTIQRKIMTPPFKASTLRMQGKNMLKAVDDFFAQVEAKAQGGIVDLQKTFRHIALRLTMVMLLNCNEKNHADLLTYDAVAELSQAFVDYLLAVVPYLTTSAVRKRSAESWELIKRVCYRLAHEKLKTARTSNDPDVIELLIKAKSIEEFEESLMTQTCLILTAGHVTTASILSSFAAYMILHPGLLERLRKEQASVPDMEEVLTSKEAFSNIFPLLDATFRELERLENPVSMLTRYAEEDVAFVPEPGSQLKPFTIRKGGMVSIEISASNRDPDLYEDPHEFRPERWIEVDPNGEKLSTSALTLTTFGAGPRLCLGRDFARMEMIGMLLPPPPSDYFSVFPAIGSYMLRKYDWSEHVGKLVKTHFPFQWTHGINCVLRRRDVAPEAEVPALGHEKVAATAPGLFFTWKFLHTRDANVSLHKIPKLKNDHMSHLKKNLPKITLAELAKHNKEDDCWIAIGGKVYDLTDFLDGHPGGRRVLLEVAGKDATKQFYEFHRPETVFLKYDPKLVVGLLEGQTVEEKEYPVTDGPFGDLIAFADPAWYQGWKSPYYNDSHRRLRAWARQIVDTKITPYCHDWETNGAIPLSLLEELGKQGFLVCFTGSHPWPKDAPCPPPAGIKPEEWNTFHELIVTDELARCGSAGTVAAISIGSSIALPPIMNFGSEFLKKKVVPDCMSAICLAITEPYAGSDVAGLQATAKLSADGTHYILNGEKKWITNGMWANFFVVAARTGGPGMNGISLLLAEKSMEGVGVRKIVTQGGTGSGTAYITFENVKIPKENLIGKENQGFKAIMYNFNHERLGLAIGALRAARVCYEEAMKHANTRKTFGQTLFEHGVIRNKVTTMSHQEALVKLGGPIALLKAQCTVTVEYCAREASQILGGISYTRGGKGEKVERVYRDVRAFGKYFLYLSIPGGSEEIMLDLGIRQALKVSQMMGAKL